MMVYNILTAALGSEVYDAVITKNMGAKGIISVACGYALKDPSARTGWFNLLSP
jgi:hypothetical protein